MLKQNGNSPFVTIFTPTFNRAHTLKRVFKSLLAQSKYDFEWLVVDDGSTDATPELIAAFQQNTPFPIRYFHQKNQGKHVATNKGLLEAKGNFFLCLDSDDALASEILTILKTRWGSLQKNQQNEIKIILSSCYNGTKSSLIGPTPLKTNMDITPNNGLEYILKNRIDFDVCAFVNTAFSRNFIFPSDKDLGFVPEAYIWNKMYRASKILLLSEVGKIVYYQQDGITKNIIKSYSNDARGRYLYFVDNLNRNTDMMLKYAPKRYVKDIIQMGRMTLHAHYIYTKPSKDINNNLTKSLYYLFFPLAYIFYLRDVSSLKNSQNKLR